MRTILAAADDFTGRVIANLTIAAGAMILTACSQGHPAAHDRNSNPPPFIPAATLQELMDAQIDPAADFIWGSVGTVITAAGVEDRRPHTDEDWAQVRHKVIALIEATNLLLIPGRRVADSDFPSAGPGVLSSTEIQRNLTHDPAGFDSFVLALRAVALQELAAVDHQDAAALLQTGEAMDAACESCHVANWYPHEIIPQLPDFQAN